MTPIVSIIMGSTSDMPVMEAAAKYLNDMQIPFEINALSAHRTPELVADFAKNAATRGIKVIIANGNRENILKDLAEKPKETIHTEFSGN